jgi:O-methyltransferase
MAESTSSSSETSSRVVSIEERYLELVKRGVMGALDTESAVEWSHTKSNSKENVRAKMSNSIRTMIGKPRLDNIQQLVQQVFQNDIQGDFLEAGSWRGGACIFMKAAVMTYGGEMAGRRTVYSADLFKDSAGVSLFRAVTAKVFALLSPVFPMVFKNWFVNQMLSTFPKEEYTTTTIDHLINLARSLPWTGTTMQFNTGLSDVKEAYRRYGLLDDKVVFLRGWFSDTLPTVPAERLAILRADGDFYGSTMDTFYPLYERLSLGGYCIVDDYGAHPECTRAVDEFRATHGITEEIIWVDHEAMYWKKEKDVKVVMPEKKWW